MKKALIFAVALTLITAPSIFAQDTDTKLRSTKIERICKFAPSLAKRLGLKCEPQIIGPPDVQPPSPTPRS